ncbi:MAG: ribonuclease P protein component [Cryomorphaceae bacterium]|nr:ribonuclease P protein component [Flavobacteriales bacterium]
MASKRFPKSERLCSKNDIETLFSGKTEGDSPVGKTRVRNVALRWTLRNAASNDPLCKVLVSVPKRNLKKAVARIRVKRMLREIYRSDKSMWQKVPASANKVMLIAVIYTGREVPTFKSLERDCHEAAAKIVMPKSPQNPTPADKNAGDVSTME